MPNIERLRLIEANAWAAYRKARQRLATDKSFRAQQKVIEEGERWQTWNNALHHEFSLERLARSARAGRL